MYNYCNAIIVQALRSTICHVRSRQRISHGNKTYNYCNAI